MTDVPNRRAAQSASKTPADGAGQTIRSGGGTVRPEGTQSRKQAEQTKKGRNVRSQDRERRGTKCFNLRMPEELHRAVAVHKAITNESMNAYIVSILGKALSSDIKVMRHLSSAEERPVTENGGRVATDVAASDSAPLPKTSQRPQGA